MENIAKTEEKDLSARLNDWLTKNKIVLISIFIVLVLAGVGTAIFIGVSNANSQKQYAAFDAIEAEYEKTLSDAALTDDDIENKKDEIFLNVTDLAKKNEKNGVGARAYTLAAEILYSKQDYNGAADNWEKAANADPKSYTAGIAYYNQAICYELMNDKERAIELFTKVAESKDFTLASKALFNCGRLSESINAFEDAKNYYTKVVENFSSDEWANLAKSRLLTLEVEGKLN